MFVLNKLLRPLTADVFCFLVLFSSRKQDFQFRCVPDRVSDSVFLAGWVTVLQRALAVLVRSCSCFLRHAFGAPAKAPRVLLPHVTGSCCVRAVPRCSVPGWRSAAGWPCPRRHGRLAAGLPARTSQASSALGRRPCRALRALLCWAGTWLTRECPGSAVLLAAAAEVCWLEISLPAAAYCGAEGVR